VSAPLRVLAVEDSTFDAELALLELRRSGFAVELKRVDSRAALTQAIESFEWDLVVCDYGLPGFSSMEALAIVQAHDPDVPFVIVSGTIGEEAAVHALHAGARDVVIKSNLSRLGAVAGRELEEARARRRHRAAEDALRQSEARKRAILDAALDAVLAVDRDGSIVEANPAAEAMFAGSSAELLGKPIVELLPIGQLLDGAAGAPSRTAARGRRIECLATRLDGEQFPADVALAQGAVSSVAFWSVTVRDLTERERAQAENRALQAQLVQSQKMEAMGRLVAGITHDFNSIIGIILGYSDLALSDAGDAAASLQAIRDAGERGLALTSQLLAFARQQIFEPVALDLNQHLLGLDTLLKMLSGRDRRLLTELAPDLRPILADPDQIGQIVLNLVANAVDATPDGGTITLATANAEVEDVRLLPEAGRAIAPGRYSVLSVSDDGVGMDAATRSQIFDPFFTTKAPGDGTGLGLSTVLGIVTQSGGQIAVDSEPGAGTTITLYLPSVDLPAAP
jgi:PAS domain S-box-containing protein